MTRRRSSFLLPNVHVPSQNEAADLASIGKHIGHLVLIIFFVYVFEDRFAIGILRDTYQPLSPPDPYDEPVPATPSGPAGAIFMAVLFVSRLATLLWLPQAIFNFCGLVMFNSFKRGVAPKFNTIDPPAVTFRSFTRGYNAELTCEVARKNLEVLGNSALQNYRVEVITDMPVGIERNSNLLERVVPRDFRPNVLNRARALQYCLEEPSENVGANEWIVHLDENVVLTDEAVQGIVNFCSSGKHHFGAGATSYTNGGQNNWVISIVDAAKIADDLGQTRFQFKIFHQPLLIWKGSWYVTSSIVEKQVGYDKIIASGASEDQYFATIANRLHYTFDFVDGEIWGHSAATLGEQIQQRKRALQASLTIALSHNHPLGTVQHWASRLVPLTVPSLIFGLFWSVPTIFLLDFLAGFIFAIRAYGYTFGVLRSFSNDMPFKALAALASPLIFVADLFLESAVCVLAVIAKDPNIQGRRKSRASIG
ncbi:Beta-1,4-mannosyltransferase bre-3 [Hypsibius exemplaris]|uniref:Beta-1,4-mannosyltransferase bre-3 n=1 Tax=Hypsibius exemplaris TaxID=2072580 RepID=A0A1W0WYI6_HYPEX|nr:Beta-1,4-mannosyltransferase bre-3 [Hypsibius exemplaris]